jgi:hypothetical protein
VRNRYYDRKKKFSSSVWWVVLLCVQYSCAVVLVFLLWRESFITTGKKKGQSSVWRVVLMCQFLVLARNRFWLYIYYYVLGVPYSCGVVYYFFWFWQEIVFGVTYVLSVQYSWAVVSVFLLWWKSFITTEKKKVLVVCLAGARSLLRLEKKVPFAIVITTGKKSSSRLSGGCAIVITTGKKSSNRDFYAKLNVVSNLNVTNLY